MRVAVYTDYEYHRIDGQVYAERAFAVFLARLAPHFDRFRVIGRLSPGSGERGRYPLGDRVELVPLPYYRSLSEPWPVLKGIIGSIRRFWKALEDTDCVWLFGPHPVAFLFAAIAALRRKRVVLGVREDMPEYVRNRHPGKRVLLFIGWLWDRTFRALARIYPIVAVGPGLAAHYRGARAVLELTVSLVDDASIVDPQTKQVSYDGELKMLSVGRLDEEKNPLLLADILARLVERDPRWRLIVCGEGSLASDLETRLSDLGVGANAELRGYVSQGGGLEDLYRESQMLLHVSWTEGLPQVLFEAFAAALPVVATDVGGIAAATGDAVSLIPAGDAAAAAEALRELSVDEALRRRRIEAGNALVRANTIEKECARVASFLEGGK
jgi:glycosyltransferase involved in cell wall biosynthesis